MTTRQPDITSLVQGFRAHIKELRAPGYKESEVRLQYIDPFWRLLGWDVENRAQLAPQDVEVTVERSIDSASDEGFRTRNPDYLFRLNGFSRFIVEAKKPSIDLDSDRNAIFQAKRYAWSAAIPFAILTNFEQFRLFDTTLKPILGLPLRGFVEEFALDHDAYPGQWDTLIATFGRDSVANGSLERLRAKVRKVSPKRRLRTVDRMLIDLKGDEPVDKAFLACLDLHRLQFARNVYRDNRKAFPDADTVHGAARLTEAVQRLMDRLVFMRVCEDRGVSEWGRLRATLDRIKGEGGSLYSALCAEFRELDASYNGYLFKGHFSEDLTVDDAALADFIADLYPPEGPWDFSKIGDDILGIVYERFLGNVVTVRQRQAEIVEKPEVRHAGGVYYTPRFVVDTIIRRVVGPKVEGKTPTEVLDVKILDPACGSGSFLVVAFQYLIDHCLRAITADPTLARVAATPRSKKGRKEIAFRNGEGHWHLAPDFKAALLTNCIHGVDIDQQAVEVTVMSLYLKMLEGTLPANWQRDWLERQLLPILDNNIRYGNSLIDSADFDRWCEEENGTLFPLDDEDVRFRINRFDWTSRTRGFGRLLDKDAVKERGRSGFDCIIGNPPYIRVQELNKWAPEECEFYKWKYESAAKGNYDIYVVFAERCLSLLAPDGLLGFIMPHKFWQAKYGEGLRKVVADGKHLKSVVDFGDQQVFKGATTYTAVHVLSKAQNTSGHVIVTRINDLTDGPAQLGVAEQGQLAEGIEVFRTSHPAGVAAWSIVPPVQSGAMAALRRATEARLKDITERMAQGIRTSKNPVYVLTRVGGHRNRFLSEHLGREVEIEPDLLHAFLRAEHMRRYEIRPTSHVVLVPYYTAGVNASQLVEPEVLRSDFPATWAYLKDCEAVLRGREGGKMDCREWYGYVYPKNLGVMRSPKILVPDIAQCPTFSLDAKGAFAFVSGYAITLLPKHARHMRLILGLLNSKPLGDFLKAVSTPLRGGWYRPFPQFISQLPIKLPTTAGDKKLAAKIVESVRAIMDAKAKLRPPATPFSGVKGRLKPAGLSDRETTVLEREVEAHERRIDEAVFALYGVDGLPGD